MSGVVHLSCLSWPGNLGFTQPCCKYSEALWLPSFSLAAHFTFVDGLQSHSASFTQSVYECAKFKLRAMVECQQAE